MRITGVATAFLRNGGRYLLMKRREDRRVYPGIWTGIGGGIDEDEMTDPEKACLREILEETGITADKITGLALRYIHLSTRSFLEGYLLVGYIFFGESSETSLIKCDEGETFWIPQAEVLKKENTPAIIRILEHYFSYAINNEKVYLFNETENSIAPLT